MSSFNRSGKNIRCISSVEIGFFNYAIRSVLAVGLDVMFLRTAILMKMLVSGTVVVDLRGALHSMSSTDLYQNSIDLKLHSTQFFLHLSLAYSIRINSRRAHYDETCDWTQHLLKHLKFADGALYMQQRYQLATVFCCGRSYSTVTLTVMF